MGPCAPLLKPCITSCHPIDPPLLCSRPLNGVPVINSANWWSSDWNVQVQLKAGVNEIEVQYPQVVALDDMRLFTFTALAVRSLMMYKCP